MFSNRYAAYLADCDDAREMHYRIRYAVYCQRKNFETPRAGDDGREWDGFDTRASHFLFRDRVRQRWQGAARMVNHASGPLPMESIGALAPEWRERFSEEPAAEVSRLSSVVSTGIGRSNTRRLVGTAIATAVEHSLARRIPWLTFMIAPGMARILEGMHIPIVPCGPVVDHRGERRAYAVHIRDNLPAVRWLNEYLQRGPVCRPYSEVMGTPTPVPSAMAIA